MRSCCPYYRRVGEGLPGDADALVAPLLRQQHAPSCPRSSTAGVDVFHPVQKHTMDEKAVAREFGDKMTFLVGFDVQHMLQEGTPDDVRARGTLARRIRSTRRVVACAWPRETASSEARRSRTSTRSSTSRSATVRTTRRKVGK